MKRMIKKKRSENRHYYRQNAQNGTLIGPGVEQKAKKKKKFTNILTRCH